MNEAAAPADLDARKHALLEAFRRFLPQASVLHTEEALKPYECDGLTAYRQVPLVAVLPETVGQVQEVMRACSRLGVPVVARGAGTGLSGGALPLAGGVLLSLAKLNRILEVDTVNRVARVQPGVRNLAISEHVAPLGLYYAPDPSSQIACSIGGNVAENAGGLHCLKYGLTVHNVLELTVITVDGERMTIGSGALDAPGYDLLALMTGSEGLLGVVVEVKVKLLPKPACARVLLAAFEDVERAGAAVGAIIAGGVLPAGLEMMDNFAIRATDDFCGAGYPTDAAAGRLSPDYLCMDGTIPRRELPAVLNRMKALSEESGLLRRAGGRVRRRSRHLPPRHAGVPANGRRAPARPGAARRSVREARTRPPAAALSKGTDGERCPRAGRRTPREPPCSGRGGQVRR